MDAMQALTWVGGFLMGLSAGCFLMRWMIERRWRENAYRIQRIESGGRLFKVLPAAIYEWALQQGAPIEPGENYMMKMDD